MAVDDDERWRIIASQSPSTSMDEGEEKVFHEDYYLWRWGSRIRYYRAGDNGPVLLLVHG